ncbi:MAG: FtsX-like permease family protein [Bacteroidetes bacterium]|jgi:predicted permease|nr:FtsX-like permease family protein [Bacteroidota bacterium]
MFKNYFKTALRNLNRHKGYTLINVLGLAVGMASCLLIFMVVRYENSYDKFQPNFNNIYHVITQDKSEDGESYTPGVPYPALEALRQDLPQVKTGALFCNFGCQMAVLDPSGKAIQSKKFVEEQGTFFMDPEFFEVFTYTWLSGSPKVLAKPNAIVLTRSTANRYFGDWKQAIGRSVKMDNDMVYTVEGILEDVPANSDYQITAVASFATLKNNQLYGYTTDWGSTTSNFQVYMLLPSAVKAEAIDQQLKALAKKYYKNEDANKRVNFLRPLSENHFDEQVGNLGNHSTSRSSLTTLSLIAFLIILMACINFVNLSTAQAVGRSKEVGVRKVLGSNRLQLFWQMLGETKVLVVISSILAIFLAWLATPYIKHVISLQEDLHLFTVQTLVFFLLTMITVTLLAGIYPAMILSGFKPVLALKNRINSSTIGGLSLRRVLVVLQFSISQLLIIGTIVAIAQMDFVRHADLGFNKDATLVLDMNNDSITRKKLAAFKQDLLSDAEVKQVSFCNDPPSSNSNWGTNFAYNNQPDENFTLYMKYADESYFETFGLKFLAGQGYAKSDTCTGYVINDCLRKKLHIKSPEDAIGKNFRTGGNPWKKIIGVVKDFNTNSLRETIRPTGIVSLKKVYYRAAIKLSSSNIIRSQEVIQQKWNRYFPEYVYNATFLDKTIEEFYQQESQMALLYKIFAGLAIFISCLGLYGLISFMAVQKTKEVGIRKVLGAKVSSIVFLFSKEFTLLILIAFVIAAPLAWYFMNSWLENFAFRIHIGFGVFAIAILSSIIIAWLSVGYKAIRAAFANPVKSLRTE